MSSESGTIRYSYLGDEVVDDREDDGEDDGQDSDDNVDGDDNVDDGDDDGDDGDDDDDDGDGDDDDDGDNNDDNDNDNDANYANEGEDYGKGDDEDDEDILYSLVEEDDGEGDDEDDEDVLYSLVEEEPIRWRMWRPTDRIFRYPFNAENKGIQLSDERVPETPLGFFQLFFTDELLQQIVDEINRYGPEQISKKVLSPHSTWKKWVAVTLVEIKKYIGLILNMGITTKPEVNLHFSEKWEFDTPMFRSVMTKERFFQIHWMLHVSSPTSGLKKEKVKDVVAYLQRKCLELYIPGCNVAIDESTIPFKGRVGVKMYNPQKPTKWGLRVYTLADSANGYITAFEPYYGKESSQELPRPDLPMTSRIVLKLCDALQERTDVTGYHLFTDRLYTSCLLAEKLRRRKMHLTGTVLGTRKGLPEELRKIKKNHLRPQEVRAYVLEGRATALAWMDKSPVLMLSTFYNGECTEISRCRKGTEDAEVVRKPTMIQDYSKYMGGVDRANHLISSYHFNHKTLKWWRKMFFWLLNVGVVNSYILCKSDQKKRGATLTTRTTHLDFRTSIVRGLTGYIEKKKTVHKPSTNRSVWHFPSKSSDTVKDCYVCSDRSKQGKRKRTAYFCRDCPSNPFMCADECFRKFHTEPSYAS